MGMMWVAFAFVPIACGICRLRRQLFRGWDRLEGGLAEVVMGIATVLLTSEVLGAVGLFRLAVVVPTFAVVGGAIWLSSGRAAPRHTASVESLARVELPSTPRWQVMVAGAVVAVVTGSWASRVHLSFRNGMTAPDAMWYHLPAAATFVQSGRFLPIKFFDSDPTTAFYPHNSEVFHALGMMFFGSDIASIVINMGWFTLALAAAWSIGRQFGVAPVTTIAIALILGTPGMVSTQAGQPLTDVVALAMLLSAFALLIHRIDLPRGRAQDLVVAAAGGFAIGTKYTFVGPIAALCVCQVITTQHGKRLGRVAIVAVGTAATGAFWFARNLFAIGNPLPSAKVRIGPYSLPSLTGVFDASTTTVSKYVFFGESWKKFFIPGFRASWGPVWLVIPLVLAIAVVISLFPRRQLGAARLAAVLAIVTFVMWLFTPQVLGAGRSLFYFGVNVRYLLPAVCFASIATAVALTRWRALLVVLLALAAAMTQADPTSWPDHLPWGVIQDRASGTDARFGLVVAAIVSLVWLGRVMRPDNKLIGSGRRLAVGSAAVILIALIPIRAQYLRSRYLHFNAIIQPAFNWARSVHNTRIAVSPQSFLQLQYPLYGPDLSNTVQLLSIRNGNHLGPPTTCSQWIDLLRAGKYDYVFLYSLGGKLASSDQFGAWTLRIAGVKAVVRRNVVAPDGATSVTVFVYRLPELIPAETC